MHDAGRLSLLTILAAAAPGACRSATVDDPLICPQTYEFGNHGCARVLAIVEGPPAPWPPSYRFDVRAVPAVPDANATLGSAIAEPLDVGPVPL